MTYPAATQNAEFNALPYGNKRAILVSHCRAARATQNAELLATRRADLLAIRAGR